MANYSNQLRSDVDKYRKKGAIEAGSMRPGQESERHHDAVEVEIENRVKELLEQEQKRVNDTTTKLENIFTTLESSFRQFSVSLNEFINSRKNLESGLNDLLHNHRSQIVELKRKRLSAEVDWRKLRSIYNIHREAEYPQNLLKFNFWIFFIAVVELALNFVFFESGEGWLTAIGVAFAVVILNLFFSFGLGWLFRFKNVHSPKWKQIGGWLCLPAYIVFTLFSNGFFSRYRTEFEIAKELGGSANIMSALKNSIPGIFDASNFQSGIASYSIFAIGFIVSLIAFYKGYTSSDEYPGYAEQDRKLKRAREAELAAIDQLNKKMTDECKKVQIEIKKNHETPSSFIMQIGNHIASLERCRDEFNRAIAIVKDDGTLLVTTYRSANRLVRPQPAPAYFDEDIVFDFRPNLRDVDDYVNKFERLRDEVENVRVNSEQHINVKKAEADKTEQEVFGDNIRNIHGAFLKWQDRLEKEAEEKLVAARALG
jgi:hypothetical protein